jgi:hypothetical protein
MNRKMTSEHSSRARGKLKIGDDWRGCDVVALRVEDVAPNGYAIARATVRQKKDRASGPIRIDRSVSGLLMPLSLRERLTMLMPPSVFYRQRIAQEARTGEPELAVLAELVPRGGIAVDVGANVGFFAYALADIADRVLAFEPNPDYAFFARWMLRGRAEVRELALSDASGRGTLYVPLSDRGLDGRWMAWRTAGKVG